ncbi:MAG: hypothetical protein A2W61_00625 [Deltaproteobacteria bacterium RIFCSPLOWO2_01_44_7]|nr:MAG: hypothetical protein A2712_05975 [Deltaproteobacteria bacterium RIFCSPHIGHO2_01_FULL_43_49]OGQ16678.1 MAG: hypothetical protein A3D22_07100 [Deltaproteobacteria bacterium RIFCSPHIGHO2_02_FULL_44_53]OGQ29816.1 MAG: hypothetical protein A3D98_09765 [Deltaproteobacteria bacterium RIFCSPHIGHO2_12_FULL_44_21]OGQ33106.1 MAG: hypothetical protein A2979_03745 [Deltaproteobacteria bacterium RIFCSPLOWO2_01_FULL_45_74]OGQ39601.1 MAG: hypothetical protein A2W61_00625 [Deltaproteobacteria bacterium 
MIGTFGFTIHEFLATQGLLSPANMGFPPEDETGFFEEAGSLVEAIANELHNGEGESLHRILDRYTDESPPRDETLKNLARELNSLNPVLRDPAIEAVKRKLKLTLPRFADTKTARREALERMAALMGSSARTMMGNPLELMEAVAASEPDATMTNRQILWQRIDRAIEKVAEGQLSAIQHAIDLANLHAHLFTRQQVGKLHELSLRFRQEGKGIVSRLIDGILKTLENKMGAAFVNNV